MKRGTMIVHNRCRCMTCGEIIESKSVHDWVCCKCFYENHGKTGCFTDGGHEYIRRGGNPEYIEDMDETRPYTDEEVDEYNERRRELAKRYGDWFDLDLMEK